MTEKGLKFLMTKEGCIKNAYWDEHGKVWTIGYGNTYWADGTPVKKGDVLKSNEEALELLKLVVPKYENAVKNALTSGVYNTLNDNQKDALTSLVYNIGGGNFKTSTVCKRVKANKDDRTIKDAFNMWNKSGGKVLKGLVTRRAEEGAMYFSEPVVISDSPTMVEAPTPPFLKKMTVHKPDSPTIVEAPTPQTRPPESQVYNYSYGDGNMFYELSHSSDWVVTKFKIIPKKTNNWKSLLTNTSRPKVGDLLFAYHDGKDSGEHDHVAIYLGVHEGNIYIAEGISVSGTNIFENNKKVQIAKIQDSRLAYDTDVITHFAHCVNKEIKQTPYSENVGLASKTGNDIVIDYNNKPVYGEDKMKHFTLIDSKAYRYKSGKSSLTYSDTAHNAGKSNAIPDVTTRQNLVNLVNNLLDPLYEIVEQQGIGKIYVSSGYRNEEINRLSSGVSNSQHKYGQAVDIQVYQRSGTRSEALLRIAQVILRAEDTIGLSYDQMILENFETPADEAALKPTWIHLSFKSKEANRTYNDSSKLMKWNSNTKKYTSLSRQEVLNKPIS